MIQSQIQRFIAVILLLTMALQGCNRSVDGFCVGGKKLPTIGANDKCPNGEPRSKCKHPRESGKSEKKEPINNSKSEPAWKGCTDKMFRRDRYETSTATNTNYSRPRSPICLKFSSEFVGITCGRGYVEARKEQDIEELIEAMKSQQYGKIREILRYTHANLNDRLPDRMTNMFHSAVKTGDTTLVRIFMDDPRIDINKKDYKFEHPLWVALDNNLANGNIEEMLLNDSRLDLKEIIDIFPLIQMALIKASKADKQTQGKYHDIIRRLLRRDDLRDEKGRDPISQGISYIEGSASTAKDVYDLLQISKESGLKIDIKSDRNENPLHNVAEFEYLLEHLLELNKYDVNQKNIDGETPLHLAAYNKNVWSTKLLLDQPGINVNIQNKFGQTPLHEVFDATIEEIFNKDKSIKNIKNLNKIIKNLVNMPDIDLLLEDKDNDIPLDLAENKEGIKEGVLDLLRARTLEQENKRYEQKGQKSGTESEEEDEDRVSDHTSQNEEYQSEQDCDENEEEDDDDKATSKSRVSDHTLQNEENQSEQEDDENEEDDEEDDKNKSKTESNKQDSEDISQQEKDDNNDDEQKSQNSEHKSENNKPIPKPKPEPEEEKKENIEEKKPDINRGEELEYLQKLEYCETDLEQRLKEIDEANKGNALNKLLYNQISRACPFDCVN